MVATWIKIDVGNDEERREHGEQTQTYISPWHAAGVVGMVHCGESRDLDHAPAFEAAFLGPVVWRSLFDVATSCQVGPRALGRPYLA